MDNLVVLTNLSPAAEHARRYAARLAGPLGARVVLLHVYQPPVLPTDTGLALSSAAYYDREQTEYALQGIAADMLVPETAALLPPRRVVIGVDGEPFVLTEPAAGVFRELLRTWQAAPTLAYVTTPDNSRSRNEVLRTVQRGGLLPEETELEFCQPLAEAPEEGLLTTAAARGASLLVLLARRRSFLGQLFHRSVTARVLRRAQLPVLLLPVAEPVAAAAPQDAGAAAVLSE